MLGHLQAPVMHALRQRITARQPPGQIHGQRLDNANLEAETSVANLASQRLGKLEQAERPARQVGDRRPKGWRSLVRG